MAPGLGYAWGKLPTDDEATASPAAAIDRGDAGAEMEELAAEARINSSVKRTRAALEIQQRN